jgi:hypothetical protein
MQNVRCKWYREERREAEREAEREQGEAVEWGELTAIPCKITGDSRWGFFLFY